MKIKHMLRGLAEL